ncbi:MAG: hypothetical protein ACM3TN_05225 [Alphaproteobacteria bacterium]
MDADPKESCKEFSSLLVKKAAGEIRPHEEPLLKNHLAQCPSRATEERELIAVFQRLDSLPDIEIRAELYERARQMILGDLQREKFRFGWFAKIPVTGPWQSFVPVTAGLAMAAASYGLVHRLINPSVHDPYVLVSLFAVWWMLFAAGSWSILKDKGDIFFPLNLVSGSAISITLLTLLVALTTVELESLRWIVNSAGYEIGYFFGIGNAIVTAWWVHCCLASFIGAFIFGVSRPPRSSENLFMGSFVVMILLSPAIYLQGASHNRGLGVIAFAGAGTYIGSLVGMGLGLFIRRKFSFQAG